jgi:hypothetical protein
MTGHYTTEEDEERRQASNRTYHRIVLSLSQEVASRYGYRPECKLTDLRNRLSAATAAENWALAAKLAEELCQKSETANAEKLPTEATEEGGVSENI